MRISRVLLAAGVAAVSLAGLFPPIASAAVPLGGGAGIVVDDSYCTLTTIGHDISGELIGITAAHCGGPGSQVVAEGTDTTAGTVVAANGDLDYAVIRFDPDAVTPISDADGFRINGIGGNPDLWAVVCRQSRATGHACSRIAGQGDDPATCTALACGNPDDAGAPVTANDLFVGMIRGGFAPSGNPCPEPGRPIPGFTRIDKYPKPDRLEIVSIDAIIDDVNTSGGPGAGFVPVPA